ncbi:hypothetical protein BUMB_03602c [Candidatus Paraburkholderia calva]|nr:hypothetical protein BUMB_03602c [Candidatus Paraburkholderia calva]
MHTMTNTLFINIFWTVAAAIAATFVFRKLAPYLWGRRNGESLHAHIERVAQEQTERALFQCNLNTTPQQALRVRVTNLGILVAFICLVTYLTPWIGFQFTNNAVLLFAAYVLVGLIACSFFKAVPAGLFAGLTWSSRTNVRLYYAWLWPLTVIKAIRRKH